MNKGLEALKRIKMLEISCDRESYDLRPITKVCKEDLDIIEKELKALEIIKKHYEVGKTIPLPNMKTYYDLLVSELTQEEFDLLKEVLL